MDQSRGALQSLNSLVVSQVLAKVMAFFSSLPINFRVWLSSSFRLAEHGSRYLQIEWKVERQNQFQGLTQA